MSKSRRSFHSKYITTIIVVLAFICAVCATIHVAGKVILEDTQLTNRQPISFSDNWSMKTDEGTFILTEPSRSDAGCLDKRLVLINELPSYISDDSAICFQSKNESVRVWIDDTLIYSFAEAYGKASHQDIGPVWNSILLPKNAPGKSITIELKPIAGRTGLEPYQFYLGNQSDITVYLLKDNFAMLIVCILFILIGISSFIVSVLSALRRNGWSTGAAFYFSLFVLLAAIWNATDSSLLQFITGNSGISYMLFGCSFYLLCAPFAMFLSYMLPQHTLIFRGFALTISAYAIVRIILYASGFLSFEAALWVLHVLIAMLILVTNLMIFAAMLRTKKVETPELFIAVSSFTLIATISLINFYSEDKLDVLRSGYSSGFYFGILSFALIVILGAVRQMKIVRQKAFKADFFEHRAYTDDLTQLLNVRGFDDKCKELLLTAPADSCYAIVDFDVNFFSEFNANNGLDAGDELLKAITGKMIASCRSDELCARQEADHFVCLLSESSLEKIISRIEEANMSVRNNMHRRMLLLSYGVVEIKDRSLTPAALRNQALVAKHTVKGNYEKNIALYDQSLHELQLQEISLLSNFESSLANGEYVIFLQPKINVSTRSIGGAEALVRHIDSNGAITSAGPIIEALEQKGFVAKLDYYILEEVCKFQRKCLANGYTVIPVSSNFSRVHLYNPSFPVLITEIVDKYGLPHELIEIELTETAFLAGKDILQSMIFNLRACGFKVAIDDFGSGYSSLNILKDVEVDTIKLDRGFLAESIKNDRANTIIEHTISLAQQMKITSVAEGIENIEQLEFLCDLGCNFVQGYYYSEPLPENEFVDKYLA